jgi:hypothetical protein
MHSPTLKEMCPLARPIWSASQSRQCALGQKERGALERHVNRVCDAAPLLTDDKRQRLAAALLEQRTAQGFPATVEDPAALDAIVGVISKATSPK